MSLRFSIVAEGNTDQAVIQNILLGYFGDGVSESNIFWVLPKYIANKSPHEKERGTWERVLQYLRAGDYREALQFPGYLVVQLDSDISTHVNFGVPHQESGTGRMLTQTELVEAVCNRLQQEIAADDLDLVLPRIIFAIGVHETQCWLVPLLGTGAAQKTTNCDHAVQQGIADKSLRRQFGLKEVSAYDRVSAPFRKLKHLRAAAKKQQSLDLFLERLNQTNEHA